MKLRKAKKRLAQRIRNYEETLKRITKTQSEGYRKPGSMKK